MWKMMNTLISKFPQLLNVGRVAYFDKRATLLNEGDICRNVFIVETGCIRSWFNNDGDDVTFQFFFPDDIVTSFESLKNGYPALYNIESITAVRLRVITQHELLQLLAEDTNIKQAIDNYIAERMYHYQKLFISRIKNKPQQRYEELVSTQPEIFEKVPHHYIAAYLGITPVSLSRIRSKTSLPINNC